MDRVGVVMFNERILLNVQPAPLSALHLANIETQLAFVQPSGGTDLWGAMLEAADLLCSLPDRNPSWMVSLTDGHSADQNRQACTERLRELDASNINVLSITIDLRVSSRDLIRHVCVDGRIGTNEIVPADGGLEAIEEAWAVVGEAMTVSERVELAEVTDAECHALLSHYMQLPQKRWSMLKQSYWVRYLARRCHILRTSEKFNMNDGFERFGSSTLKIMMEEAHHALSDDYRHDWDAINHEQFVYWEEDGDSKWSLIATKPSEMSGERRQLLDELELRVPSADDLRKRRVLDSLLARGLGIDAVLQDRAIERRQRPIMRDGQQSTIDVEIDLGTIAAVDEHRFVLTLDFTMKMLCMHERIECRVPCIMEGETGVSKTALTRMYFILKNLSCMSAQMQDVDNERLRVTVDQLRNLAAAQQPQDAAVAFGEIQVDPVVRTLQRMALSLFCFFLPDAGFRSVPQEDWNDAKRLATYLCDSAVDVNAAVNIPPFRAALLIELKQDPGLLVDNGLWQAVQTAWSPAWQGRIDEHSAGDISAEVLADLLLCYIRAKTLLRSSPVGWTFHQLNVHAALTPAAIEADLAPIIELGFRLQEAAEKLNSSRHRNVKLCIFLDEVNTSSTMGVFKELIVDRRLDGCDLPENVVVIAACNPAREKLVHFSAANARREELGKEWAMGHYQVHPLPLSIEQVTWDYGSLKPEQEAEFIEKRMSALYRGEDVRFPYPEQRQLAALMCRSQDLTRAFAQQQFAGLKERIIAASPRPLSTAELQRMDVDLNARASSVVSLRDIQRVFTLFRFFDDLLQTQNGDVHFFMEGGGDPERRRRSMLLTIGVVYYLRLSTEQRVSFECDLHQMLRDEHNLRLDKVLAEAMDALIQTTELEPGIARTTGLKENVFMVVVCTLARIPLMIVRAVSSLSHRLSPYGWLPTHSSPPSADWSTGVL